MESRVLEKLEQFDQKDWEEAVLLLQEEIHPVDRDAVWIWFSFWPLKLWDALQKPEELEELIREWRLRGNYRLADQLDQSVSYLYGSRWWPEVKKAVLSWDGESKAIAELVRGTSAPLAARLGVSPDLLTGITAVAWMALRQVGPDSFGAAVDAVSPSSRRSSPESIAERRERNREPGFWERLVSGADRRHRVYFDEKRPGEFFQAREEQDLSMASRSDERDYQSVDPRCLEGPIPFECRSGSCGHCWVGILGGRERLAEQTDFERQRLLYFGYLSPHVKSESHPVIRLACQSHCHGDVTLVIPPWNGMLDGRL